MKSTVLLVYFIL